MSNMSWSKNVTGLFVRVVVVTMLTFGIAPLRLWEVPLRAQTSPIVITPTLGVTPRLNIVTVNNGPGPHYDPHVSGDLVAYTANISPATIRYFRFSTGIDTVIPLGNSANDILSDVNAGRIAFTRILSDRKAIVMWDTSTSTLKEVDPLIGSNRQFSAIGGNTLAYVDYGIGSGTGEIIAHDIAQNVSRRTYSRGATPNVSPDGNTIVWHNCSSFSPLVCDVMAATWNSNAAAWNVTTVAAASDPAGNPDTDGTWIVYDANVTGNATGQDIYFRPVTGGPTRQLALPRTQWLPRINKGLISFVSGAPGEIFVYVIATNKLYQITPTPGFNKDLSDIDVLANGDIRLVWSMNDGSGGERNVYATRVTLPTTITYQTCHDPLVAKRGGTAKPLKLQLCDANDNNLSRW